MLTIKQINKMLESKGTDARLARGEGYFISMVELLIIGTIRWFMFLNYRTSHSNNGMKNMNSNSQQTNDKPKICKDCKHYNPPIYEVTSAYCASPNNGMSVVTGVYITKNPYFSRNDGKACGPTGRFFEAKESKKLKLFEKFKSLVFLGLVVYLFYDVFVSPYV